jgi:Flp pilus assembly pilin Flp
LRRGFAKDESGNAAAEYALILALVAAALMGAFMHMGHAIRNVDTNVASAIQISNNPN